MSATPLSMLKVVTTGLQDFERLNPPIGQPSLKNYSYVLRRRTRWASYWRRVGFDTRADFGRSARVTLPQSGELITRAVLVIVLPDLEGPQAAADAAAHAINGGTAEPKWYWTNSVGHAVCSSVTMSVSDVVVDRVDSRLMNVIDEQEHAVEHFVTTNDILMRDPSSYPNPKFQKANTTLEIVVPFWWNRGIGPQALPIQALNKEKVQINCQFRTVQELIYTTARTAGGALPTMAGSQFYNSKGGEPLAGHRMPTEWKIEDAYWIVEYVSLEEREAAAFRLADLQIPIEQHVALPVMPTEGARNVRMRIEAGGLVRELQWVAQRTQAPEYNAYFHYAYDLGPHGDPLSTAIQWPNAQIPSWDYGDGYIRPAYCDYRSDPIQAAALWYRGKERFNHEGPSMFRSLIPALGSRRTPLVNRYIYRYDFGLWPTGGLAETLFYTRDEVRGAANWDKLPGRELQLTMNQPDCGVTVLEAEPETTAREWSNEVWHRVDDDFPAGIAGFEVLLKGAGGGANGGGGASVAGIVDFKQLKGLTGYEGLFVRCVPGGSAALVIQLQTDAGFRYIWIAVAGAGGEGGWAGRGGHAGSAVKIGGRGGDQVLTHAGTVERGGGGGGRLSERDVGLGLGPGTQMPVDDVGFMVLMKSTGGLGINRGGDGELGGASGEGAGGGGGSYVSHLITKVASHPGTDDTDVQVSSVRLTPVRRVDVTPKFNIYAWLTRYNMLRIYGGRAALLFAD